MYKWLFFRRAAFSADFRPATYFKYASAKTLVRPCPSKKPLIYRVSGIQYQYRIINYHAIRRA